MKKYRLATAPERAATLEIEYDSWGWIVSLSASYAGERWVAPTPLRRMERVYRLATSEEQHKEFTRQEKLPDAFTLNLFILKSLNLSKGRVTATVSVNNLLGKNTIYHGYEQMRVRRTNAVDGWRPFESKYLNNYGRTYYVSATYAF